MTFRKILQKLIGSKSEQQEYKWVEGESVFTRALPDANRKDNKKPVIHRAPESDSEEEMGAFITASSSNEAEVPQTLRPHALIMKSRALVLESFKLLDVLDTKGYLKPIKEYAIEQRKENPDKVILQQLESGLNLSLLKLFNDTLECLEQQEQYYMSTPSYVIENPTLRETYDGFKGVYKDKITEKLKSYADEKILVRQVLEKNKPAPISVDQTADESASLLRRPTY
jgi:hypothetical protein